jgi:hypothetical protein
MMVFNIVRQGALGEILHAEGGYLHDLREIKFERKDEGLWRRAWATKLDGNPYPTHGLGPIANCLDVNRGDRFDYLVSMSGPSRGLQDWAREHLPADAPERKEQYVLGDVNTSLIKTALGRTVMVQHCTNLPRPYSRIHVVQGTKGMFQGYPNRLYIEGRGKPHQWVDALTVRDEFDHPLWKELESRAEGAGHGGMDYIEDFRLIACLRAGVKYGRAINHAVRMADHIRKVCDAAGQEHEIELSVDETEQPTTLAEHYIIADQCLSRGMKLVSLAPRFIGDFEKGVDYKGDLAAFERSLADHAAIDHAECSHAQGFIADAHATEAQDTARRIEVDHGGKLPFRSMNFFFRVAAFAGAVAEDHVL